MRSLVLFAIATYRRWFSPLKPACCRFAPTCSSYAYEAVQVHGVARGGALAIHRLCRCHPWGGSGFDPVPLASAPEHATESPSAAAGVRSEMAARLQTRRVN